MSKEEILYVHWAKWAKETFKDVDISAQSFHDNFEHSFVLDAMEQYNQLTIRQASEERQVEVEELKKSLKLCNEVGKQAEGELHDILEFALFNYKPKVYKDCIIWVQTGDQYNTEDVVKDFHEHKVKSPPEEEMGYAAMEEYTQQMLLAAEKEIERLNKLVEAHKSASQIKTDHIRNQEKEIADAWSKVRMSENKCVIMNEMLQEKDKEIAEYSRNLKNAADNGSKLVNENYKLEKEIAELKERFEKSFKLAEIRRKEIDKLILEQEPLKKEIADLKEWIEQVDKSLYIGEDLNDVDILKWYIDVVKVIKEEAQQLLTK